MKTFKFLLVLRTRENTYIFITLDETIYDIHHKRVNILYIFQLLGYRKEQLADAPKGTEKTKTTVTAYIGCCQRTFFKIHVTL